MASYLYYLLPAVGGYALTSLYFLKNPHILHKKKQTAFYCTHISHRGGTVSESIASSCLGFGILGTEMLELDCHLTKDGHVVELPPYNETLEVTFKTGVCFYHTGSDRNFALLEDVFRKFPHIAVNIEVKENNSMLVEKAREQSSYSISLCLLCCQWQNSSMPYMFTVKRGLKLLLLYYTGLLPFVPSERINLFVCNKEEDIKTAFAAGATGVMVDYPTLLSNYIRRHTQDT
uniref:Glycerophosphodiester phosphodiesterase domain containing 3a n=1 Tax=Sinocyclocheilus anshuiensis TaxID=1608454 RepID=A0A671PTG1_9TELE